MHKIVLSILCALCGLAFASGAFAQAGFSGPISNGGLRSGASSMSAALVDPRSSSVVSVMPTRLDRQRHRNGIYANQPTATQVLSSSQSEMNTANIDCRVVDAKLLGYNADQQAVYEVSCGSGMGYVLGAASPPQVTDCITIAARAEMAIKADASAKPLRCSLTANQNVTGMISNYARTAGVGCPVDQAVMVGTSVAGNPVYEVGCEGAEGYWLERTADAWTRTPCAKVAATGTSCRFTTAAETAASAKIWLAGSAGSNCDVTDVRYMGASSAGAFYEAKCGAGDGYVARLDDALTVQQVYPCAQAASIGGGCKLGASTASSRQ